MDIIKIGSHVKFMSEEYEIIDIWVKIFRLSDNTISINSFVKIKADEVVIEEVNINQIDFD